MIYHLAHLDSAPEWIRNFGGSGYVSVSMFFVLSGFVLAYNYLDDAPLQVRKLWVARFARIAPAYWTSMVIALPIWVYKVAAEQNVPLSLSNATASAFISFFCLQAWFAGSALIWNAPAWSLSCEWFFYLLFPVFAKSISSLSHTRLKHTAWAFAFLSMIVPIGYLILQPDHVSFNSLTQFHLANFTNDQELLKLRSFLWSDAWYRIAIFNPFSHLPMFALGMILGRYRRANVTTSSVNSSTCAHLSLIAIIVLLSVSGRVPHILLHNSLIGILFAIFIFNSNALWKPIRRFLTLRPVLRRL